MHTKTKLKYVEDHSTQPSTTNLSQHRSEIVCWVSESAQLFKIVADHGFQCLMKTGRPELYIPSPTTVLRDVKLVFARTHEQIAKMLQVDQIKLSSEGS